MRIRYQGIRPRHRDNLYQTGDWREGDVKEVPEETATKLLRHPDVFRRAKNGAEAVETVAAPEPERLDTGEAARLQEARDIVNGMMDKQAVADFALANWQRKLNQRQSLDNLKRETVMLIDQYGLP